MKDDFNIFILCHYNVIVHAVIIYKLLQVVTNGIAGNGLPLPCFVNIILYALFSFVWVTDLSFLYDPNKLIFVYATVCWWICQSCLIDTQIVFIAFLIFKALNTTECQRTIFILSLFLDKHTFYRKFSFRIK